MPERKQSTTNFKSAEELFYNPVEGGKPDMIVDGLIPTGLTIIAGAPKSCKSWLMLRLALSVSLGEPFLGHDVKKCDVAYYALEDTDARLKSRLLDIGTAPPPGLIYATSVKDPCNDFISDLERCLDSNPEVRLVIVDTLQKIRNSDPTSNANQYVNVPAETGIVLNTPFSIYRTLSKKPMIVPNYMSDAEAAQYFSPIHEANDSVAFQPKNVVVIILESFSKQHMGYYNPTLRGGAYRKFTPFIDSLITHGAMTWQYSYANGRKSIEGMPSTLSSLPNYIEPLFLTPASLNSMSGLARELGENEGYQTAFFHGAQNGSMGFQAFARATGFQQYFGRTEYNQDSNYNGDDDFDGTWAVWDEEFLQFYSDRMSEMKQPFMTAVFTASSHTPYALPERYKGVFPKGEEQLEESIAYTDHALRLFFAKARRQPWFQNTLFVITADHTSRQIDPFYTTSLGYYCVPIIFYAPSDTTLHGYDMQHVVEQVDIMPTVLGYLHYDHPYLAFGKDMLNTPAEETFALHWVPESNGYEFVKGNYALEFDGNKVTAAYRFRTDSVLRDNVLTTMPKDTLQQMTKQMKSVIQQYMQRMTTDKLTIKK